MLLRDLASYVESNLRISARAKTQIFQLMGSLLVSYLFVESYLFGYRLVNTSLVPAERSAMLWVRENTSVDSQLVILTGTSAPELDAFQEWFPALAERKSLTTFQGTEWTLGSEFFQNFRELKQLQSCTKVDCLHSWIEKNGISFDYILARKKNIQVLVEALRMNSQYQLIYEDEVIAMFAPR
jgi:hypothetical protein